MIQIIESGLATAELQISTSRFPAFALNTLNEVFCYVEGHTQQLRQPHPLMNRKIFIKHKKNGKPKRGEKGDSCRSKKHKYLKQNK